MSDIKALAERLATIADGIESIAINVIYSVKSYSSEYQEVMEYVSELRALTVSPQVSGGGECNCASGRGAEHCVVHAPSDAKLYAHPAPQADEKECKHCVDGIVPMTMNRDCPHCRPVIRRY